MCPSQDVYGPTVLSFLTQTKAVGASQYELYFSSLQGLMGPRGPPGASGAPVSTGSWSFLFDKKTELNKGAEHDISVFF